MVADIRYPVIDLPATGENILRMRESRGFSVRDLQQFFGFDAPQAIYKWQRGQTLPSVDNLFALAALFRVSIDEILIPVANSLPDSNKQQAAACCSAFLQGNQEFRHPKRDKCRISLADKFGIYCDCVAPKGVLRRVLSVWWLP